MRLHGGGVVATLGMLLLTAWLLRKNNRSHSRASAMETIALRLNNKAHAGTDPARAPVRAQPSNDGAAAKVARTPEPPPELPRQYRAGTVAEIEDLIARASYTVNATCDTMFYNPRDTPPITPEEKRLHGIPVPQQCNRSLLGAMAAARAKARAAAPGALGFYMKLKEEQSQKVVPACTLGHWRGKWLHFSGDSTMRNIANGAMAALGFPERFYYLKRDQCHSDPQWTKEANETFLSTCRDANVWMSMYDQKSDLLITFGWKNAAWSDDNDLMTIKRLTLFKNGRRPDVIVGHAGMHEVDQYNTKKHGTAYNNAEWVSRPNWLRNYVAELTNYSRTFKAKYGSNTCLAWKTNNISPSQKILCIRDHCGLRDAACSKKKKKEIADCTMRRHITQPGGMMELLDAVTRPVMLAEGVHLFDPSDMTYHNLKVGDRVHHDELFKPLGVAFLNNLCKQCL